MGAARVYLGGTAMDTVADVTILGASANAQLGESVARLGDVDGDGADDFLVGAFNESSGLGAARVYLGGAGLDEVADIELLGSDPSAGYFGYSVAGAGDVNGDGGQDIIVGAYNESAGLGTARIYLGTSGPVADDTAADTGADDADEGEDEDDGDDHGGCGDGHDGHGGHGDGHGDGHGTHGGHSGHGGHGGHGEGEGTHGGDHGHGGHSGRGRT